mgnify:CR=1 FL=1
MKRIYVPVRWKFVISIAIVFIYVVVCTIIEIPWWHELNVRVGPFIATLMIAGLAFFPGIMISVTLTGILLDHPKRYGIVEDELEDVTILVAAYNEGKTIYDTLKSLSQQDYPQTVYIKVIDNNSKDNTKEEIRRAQADFPHAQIEYLFEGTQGKFAALNHALTLTNTKYVMTIDADTYLYKDAIKIITNHMTQENKNKQVGAVAGAVLVKNSRVNVLTKMQEWEYFLSIANIKRCQGLFQSVLVAQGAFSIYDTALLKEIGGWKDSIGEDIVLTWEILSRGYVTHYEDRAISFTNAPTQFSIFSRQRARWARGMIEGFRHFSFKRCTSPYAKFFIFCDLFLFIIDFSITLFYIPGMVAFIFLHDFIIAGPMTLILFPITLAMFLIMYIVEYNHVFKPLGLHVRKHYLSLVIFILSYSILTL